MDTSEGASIPSDSLTQYGALGFMVLGLLYGLGRLAVRELRRADRLEQENRQLQQDMRDLLTKLRSRAEREDVS